jgi:hypothetical protein
MGQNRIGSTFVHRYIPLHVVGRPQWFVAQRGSGTRCVIGNLGRHIGRASHALSVPLLLGRLTGRGWFGAVDVCAVDKLLNLEAGKSSRRGPDMHSVCGSRTCCAEGCSKPVLMICAARRQRLILASCCTWCMLIGAPRAPQRLIGQRQRPVCEVHICWSGSNPQSPAALHLLLCKLGFYLNHDRLCNPPVGYMQRPCHRNNAARKVQS